MFLIRKSWNYTSISNDLIEDYFNRMDYTYIPSNPSVDINSKNISNIINKQLAYRLRDTDVYEKIEKETKKLAGDLIKRSKKIKSNFNYENINITYKNTNKITVEPEVSFGKILIQNEGSGFNKDFFAQIAIADLEHHCVIVDEFENSFSIENEKNFIDSILKKDNQLIVTSHRFSVPSHHQINLLSLYKDKEGNYVHDIEKIEKVLGDKLQNNIAFVEGRTDFWCMPKDVKDFLYIQVEGANNIPKNIEINKMTKKNFFIICDYDTKGKEVIEESLKINSKIKVISYDKQYLENYLKCYWPKEFNKYKCLSGMSKEKRKKLKSYLSSWLANPKNRENKKVKELSNEIREKLLKSLNSSQSKKWK